MFTYSQKYITMPFIVIFSVLVFSLKRLILLIDCLKPLILCDFIVNPVRTLAPRRYERRIVRTDFLYKNRHSPTPLYLLCRKKSRFASANGL